MPDSSTTRMMGIKMTNPDTLDLNLASAADKRTAVPYSNGNGNGIRE